MRPALLTLCLCCSAAGIAQRAVLPCGHDATGASGSLSCSIGQVDYRAHSAPNGTAAQGVQQPYDWLVLAVMEPLGGALGAALRPNPATDQATLTIAGVTALPLSFALRDAQGRLLGEGPITSASASIPLLGLPPANYLVQVLEGGRPQATFQVIKH